MARESEAEAPRAGAPGGRSDQQGARESTFLERVGATAARAGSIGAERPRLRAAIQYGVVVLIFGFLVGFVASQWSRLPDFDWRFSPGWLVAAAVGVTLFYLLEAEAWRFILARLGDRLEGPAARAIWGKSLLARYVPTNALMVVGRVMLAERLGVRQRVCLASIVYELGLAICAAVIVGAYFVVNLPLLADQPARFAVLAVIPLALAALHPRAFGPLADFALGKLGREPLPRTLPFRTILGLIAVYVVVWLVIGAGIFAFASAVYPVALADLPYVAAAQSVAFGVAVVTFLVPSGLGTRDAALAAALAVVLPVPVAAAIAVGLRLFQTAIELLFVGAVVLLARRRAAAGYSPG